MIKYKTIYEYFSGYTEGQVDNMLKRLSEREMELLKLRYGSDLSKPAYNEIRDSEVKREYNNLVAKMKRLLQNPNMVLKPRKKKIEVSKDLKKEEYIKMLNFFKSSNFNELLKVLTPKEAVIICLKFGYIDNKYYDTKTIANFLEIKEEEVIEVSEKILLIYKKDISKIVNEAIDYVCNSLDDGYVKKK